MPKYQLKQGDCIYCISRRYGMLAEVIWAHPDNSEIKAKRKAPGSLAPGDVIFLPEKRSKEVSEQTNQVHKFATKWKEHPHWIEIELIDDDDKPVPSAKYVVTLPDGAKQEGTLDQDGWARIEALPNGECQVSFPDFDQKAWKHIETVGPKS